MKTKQKNIPEVWNIRQLEEVARTLSGGTPKSGNEEYYLNGNIPWLTSGEVRKGKVSSFDNFITKKGLENSSAKLFPPKTILVAMYGATAGQVGFLEKEAATNQAICGILPNEKYSSLFLYHYFTTRTKQLLSMGTGAAQPNISQEILRTLDINFPSLLEQKRIVKILETWNGAIEKLARKIEIKKNIKKGLMQRLLTGETRLSGFKSVWKSVKLGDIYNITSSKRVFQSEWKTEGVPFYRAREIIKLSKNGYVDNELYISQEMYDLYKSKYGAPQINDLLVTGVGTIGEVYMVQKNDNFYFKDGNIVWLKYKSEVSSVFISQLFKTRSIRKQVIGSSPITTVATYTIDAAKKTVVNLPPIKEQNEIAEILTIADSEIERLTQKLNLLKDQKKYLLNNLITGKIRTPKTLSTTK